MFKTSFYNKNDYRDEINKKSRPYQLKKKLNASIDLKYDKSLREIQLNNINSFSPINYSKNSYFTKNFQEKQNTSSNFQKKLNLSMLKDNSFSFEKDNNLIKRNLSKNSSFNSKNNSFERFFNENVSNSCNFSRKSEEIEDQLNEIHKKINKKLEDKKKRNIIEEFNNKTRYEKYSRLKVPSLETENNEEKNKSYIFGNKYNNNIKLHTKKEEFRNKDEDVNKLFIINYLNF